MNKPDSPIKQLKNYTRFSGLAFQMGIIIAIGTIGGVKLDAKWELSPLFTLIGSLGSITISLYLVIKELSITKNKKNGKNPG